MILTVEVTEEDITQSKSSKLETPISLALNRQYPNRWVVARKYEHPCQKLILLPDQVQTFMEIFVKGENVTPFTFQIEINDDYAN